MNTPTLRQAANILSERFSVAHSDAPRICAQVLLCHVLQVDAVYFASQPDKELTKEQWEQVLALALRHEQGEPLAYIIGYKEFFGRKFLLNRQTLIPRPATEDVLEAALHALKVKAPYFLDIGTGSGCLGLSIAAELEHAQGILLDIQLSALHMARQNAKDLGLMSRVKLVQGNLCSLPLAKKSFDLIVSNPPYVSEQEYTALLPNVRDFEPKIALVPYDNANDVEDDLGLLHIEYIAKQAYTMLKEGGVCIVEHGYLQGKSVHNLFEANGIWASIKTGKDLAGLDRYCICVRS